MERHNFDSSHRATGITMVELDDRLASPHHEYSTSKPTYSSLPKRYMWFYIVCAGFLLFCTVTSVLLWNNETRNQLFGIQKNSALATQPFSQSGANNSDSEFLLQRIDVLEKKVTLLNDTLRNLIAKSPDLYDILGYVDDVLNVTNGFVLRGWACNMGLRKSISIEIYVGGPVGSGTFLKQATADVNSEAGVSGACQTTNSAHRFYVLFKHAELSSFVGKTVYVYGISQTSEAYNALLRNSGTIQIPKAAAMPLSSLRGHIDDIIMVVNGFVIRGWSCEILLNQSIYVSLYLGGAPGFGGVLEGSFETNVVAETNVSLTCGTNGVSHRFYLFSSKEQSQAFVGKGIFVSGNSSGNSLLLDGSGKYRVPFVTSGSLRGEITSINTTSQGDRLIQGWACDYQQSYSITVQFYAGNPMTGYGISISQAISSSPSTSDISLKCGTSQVNHGFSIQVPAATASLHAGKGMFVLGLTLNSVSSNELLLNSGLYRF